MRSSSRVLLAGWIACAITCASSVHAEVVKIDYRTAVDRARARAPDLVAARAREAPARAAIGVGGTYPNPTFIVGTSTQTALFSGTLTVPLVVFGQIGHARDAARAELATVRADTNVAAADVTTQAAHAFVALWLSERVAEERTVAATIERALELAVQGRVEVGSAPELDALRTHAEQLRADADARASSQLVDAASAALERWIGSNDDTSWRTDGDPFIPAAPPPLASLRASSAENTNVRREQADERAALARASHERSLVAPTLAIDLGVDVADPTLPATNFRAALTFDLPIFNHRGSYVERENLLAAAAHARADAERARASSEVVAAYKRFEAATSRAATLKTSVVPASEAAATAIEDAYKLGRATLVMVLDAERARIDTRLALQQARAEQADAWIDVERAAGVAR